MKNVFLDTNIFIDFLAHRGEFYEPAALIVSLGIQDRIRLQVSALSFATADFILSQRQKWPSSRIVSEFKRFIEICQITTIDEETIKKSTLSHFEDFEDGMQYNSALAFSSDVIVTRNVGDFSKSRIPVMEPNDFLDIWEEEHQDELETTYGDDDQ